MIQKSTVISFLKFPKKLRRMFLMFPLVSKKQFHKFRLVLTHGKTRGNKGIKIDVAGTIYMSGFEYWVD